MELIEFFVLIGLFGFVELFNILHRTSKGNEARFGIKGRV